MIIEGVRLVVTLATTAAGFLVGRGLPGWFERSELDPDVTIVLGAVIGAGVGYVFGGLLGRMIRKGLDRAPELVSRATGPELFAGAFGLLSGLAVGVVLAVPLVWLLPSVVGWPIGALIVLVLAASGARVFAARADDLLAAAGLRAKQVPGTGVGAAAHIIDTSAAIDGRVLELCRGGLIVGEVWLPQFVADELQAVADSASPTKRRRGRRGLDVLDAIRGRESVRLIVIDDTVPEHAEVDAKLVALCDRSGAALITTDHNLAAVAALRGVRVVNPHAIGESLRPQLVVGDRVNIVVERQGSEPGQGVGFLDDGTMVVVEDGASLMGELVEVEVANALRTTVGRMLFARVGP